MDVRGPAVRSEASLAAPTGPSGVAPSLGGWTVGILEARRGGELAQLVATYGGRPVSAPALREEPVEDVAEIATFLDALRGMPPDTVIFQTGVGTRALHQAIGQLGRLEEWHALLNDAVLVVRGPKPTAALREQGHEPDLRIAEPYTTAEMLAALSARDLRGKTVAVQHYGEPNVELVDALRGWGATVVETEVYRWALPEDLTPLEDLIRAIATGGIAVLLVTSQVQVRHLFAVAERIGLAAGLPEALRQNTYVAAVGPVAARALAAYGVRVDRQPSHPKMGALVREVAEHVESSRAPKGQSHA